MQRNATWILLPILGFGLNALAQQPVAAPPVAQVAPPELHKQEPPGGRQPLNQNQKPIVTNADVIKMVKGGVPESAILTSIQSSPNKFDLSPGALIGLRKAGVSQKILDAMTAAGGGRHAPTTANGRSGSSSLVSKTGVAPLKIKLGPPKVGPQIKNPHVVQANAAIIAVLQKQRQAAGAEAAQMKLGIRPVGQNGLPAVQSESTSGFTDPNKSGIPAVQSHAKSSTSANRATAAMPSAAQKPATPGMIGPGKTSDTTGNSASSMMVHAIQLPTTALTCTNDPTMRILNVSGESFPATFTPDAQYNFYTIAGCSFGDPSPNSKVYIYYQDTFHQEFQIQEWNDSHIKLNLNPSLRGLLDHDNLTLVIQRADGKQATKGGFKFYAVRETTRLARIPQSEFSLNHFSMNDTSHLQPIYNSPPLPEFILPGSGEFLTKITGILGHTAEVYWRCDNCRAIKGHFDSVEMTGNEDIYKFNALQPGFDAVSAGMVYRNLDCSGSGSLHTEGQFGAKWVGDELHVLWQGQTCVREGCDGAFQPDCFNSATQSDYAVDVWVIGPRGVDPWTGKPNQ